MRFFAIGILILAIYFFRDIVAIFLSSIVIATVAEGPIRRLVRRGFPRFVSVTLIYIGGLILLSLLFYFLTPVVVTEFSGATSTLLEVLQRLFRSELFTSNIIPDLQQNLFRAFQGIGDSAGAAVGFVYRMFGGILSVVLAFVISFYLALQGQTIERLIKALTREEHTEYFLDLWARSQRKIGRWFYGQIVLSLFVGLLVFVGLWIMGVNYSFLLGILAAVFEIVPVVGPLIAGVFAVVIATHQSINMAIYTVILFAIIQQIENNIFVPAIMRRSIGLNPVVVVFVLLIGGKLAGFWGILLAVPITAALSELFQDWEEKKLPM